MSDKLSIPRLVRKGKAPETGIVHFGPGAFFRAFNAMYTDDVLAAEGGDWGITAVSLKSPTARDQLLPQNGVYHAVELAPEARNPRLIQTVNTVLLAADDPQAVLDVMSDSRVKIVSLTITEKGYCHHPATGRLNSDHPDITADLKAGALPCSAPGFIVAALAARRSNQTKPFTVLSCDNLPANGALTKNIVLDFARQYDPGLAEWIAAEVPFPSTMVDRITPATTEQDIENLAEETGFFDPGCVVHEPFRQWVIENNFADGHPPWDRFGAQLVDSVEAHELMKLRCLNGTHSTLAYLGYLAGYETVAETVSNPLFSGLCTHLWENEILPTVPRPEGEDLTAYCDALLSRYRNPSIHHRTWQIAMDGSQKLPQRILATISDNLNKGVVPHGLCLAVAGWIRYVSGIDEHGNSIDVHDPHADRLKRIADTVHNPVERVAAFLSLTEIFDPSLARNSSFKASVTKAMLDLQEQGTVQTIERLLK